MKILHVTHNPDWFKFHFESLCAHLGHTGETFHKSEYTLGASVADSYWTRYREYFESFDAVFVSHLASWSRVFLQNGWKKPLYVWLYFRFDYDVPDKEAYRALIRDAWGAPNVKFFAATEQDKLYTQSVLGALPLEVIPPLYCVNHAEKHPIPCGKDTFFLVDKHNEKLLADRLQALHIPVYKQVWTSSVPDLRGVRGIIHLPYACNPRSLWENLAMENVYFLPSEAFFHELRAIPGYFWDSFGEPTQPQGFSLTEWFKEENKQIFVHYSSFDDLQHIANSSGLPELVAEKKQCIREATQRHNAVAIQKWGEIFKET